MAQRLAEALATRVAEALAEAVAVRGEAAIAVSGGSTPKAFFKALSVKDIAWPKVVITLVDERFVSPDNDRSNHALVSAMLLQDKAAAAKFLRSIMPLPTPRMPHSPPPAMPSVCPVPSTW